MEKPLSVSAGSGLGFVLGKIGNACAANLHHPKLAIICLIAGAGAASLQNPPQCQEERKHELMFID